LQYDLRALLEDLYDRNVERWRAEARGKELGVR
jgi:hypothetical protein